MTKMKDKEKKGKIVERKKETDNSGTRKREGRNQEKEERKI